MGGAREQVGGTTGASGGARGSWVEGTVGAGRRD